MTDFVTKAKYRYTCRERSLLWTEYKEDDKPHDIHRQIPRILA